jgi:two-component system response regulator HydG
MPSNVLIVDDDFDARELIKSILSSDGHACEGVPDAAAAVRRVQHGQLDLILSDVVMGGMSGLDLLDVVKRSQPELPVVLVTGAAAVPQAVEAIKRGAFDYLLKPCDVGGLRRVVRDALERPRATTPPSLSRPPSATFHLVGSGPAMQALQKAIDSVARSEAPVLVHGETGVGKELVARTIHARSARGPQPFVAVNCAAIPHELLEGELFGHVRGAFTGAARARKGLVTEADGGTLLLDEIGDMPLALQAKLLRVLQFGEVRPLGTDGSHRVDVRVIACTHRDLPALVQEGRFREDLYFRLNVLPILVPPLREHREDIPALVEHLLAGALARTPSATARSFGPDVLQRLQQSHWPGNVRELASWIERAVVFGLEETVDSFAERATPPAWPCSPDAPWPLRRLSESYVDWVIAQSGGRLGRAAEVLGVNLSTLYRWQRRRTD